MNKYDEILHKLRQEKDLTLMEAVIDYCDTKKIDVTDFSKRLSDYAKEELEKEAQKLNLLK